MAQWTVITATKEKKRSGRPPERVKQKRGDHAHFVNSLFENTFSIGTSCFLHHAAVILRTAPMRKK
jgi:hypothetical protein